MPFIVSEDGTIIQMLSLPSRTSIAQATSPTGADNLKSKRIDDVALENWFRTELSMKEHEFKTFERQLAISDQHQRRQGRRIQMVPKRPEIPDRLSSLNFRSKYDYLVCFRPVRWLQ
jgi:hypothetical protein